MQLGKKSPWSAVRSQKLPQASLATDHRLRTRDLAGNESGIGNRESGIGNRESGIGDEDKVHSIDGGNFRLSRSLAALSGRGLRTSDLLL
jgi:hypothetical protein